MLPVVIRDVNSPYAAFLVVCQLISWRLELMMHASRDGKAPQRDVTAVDNDPRCEFNLKLEPAIKAGSGVKATAVDSGQAAACAAFLQQQWRGSARLGEACWSGFRTPLRAMRRSLPHVGCWEYWAVARS